jgi:hypothetical protein
MIQPRIIITLFLLAATAISNILYAQQGVSIRNEGTRIIIIADPRVNMKRVLPLKTEQGTALKAAAAPIQINFLEAGSTNALWGDNAITWPTAASNAVVYGASIWETLLNSTVPITINAAWVDNLGAGVLGHSGSIDFFRDFSGAPVASTWYSATLANSLHGSDLEPSDVDIYMGFSSTFSWYTGTDANPPGSQYDLVSVVLHEICHGLGFAGSMNVSGGQGSWGAGTSYPFIYDRFTEDAAGVSLLNTGVYPNPSAALKNALTTGDVYFDGVHANAANGSVRVPLYTPTTWNSGSSYSHLDEVYNGTPHALMTYSLGFGEAIHSPGTITLGLLEDLGWSVVPIVTQTYTLTIQSVNPASGVPIVVSPPDNNGDSNGNTDFTRIYDEDTTVTLAAPLTAANNVFQRWELDSVSQGTNRVLQFDMVSNRTAVAVYAPLLKPINVSATDGVYSNKVTISWTASPRAGYYQVFRSSANDSNTAVNISGPVMGTVYDDSSADYAKPYFYWVRAGAGAVVSPLSDVDSGYAYVGGIQTVTLLNENFEGAFPGTTWSLYNSPTWGLTTYRSQSATHSAYCCGSTIAAPGPYPADMQGWMIHGPFDLSDTAYGKLTFDAWVKSESGYDVLFFGFSTDGFNFNGYIYSGDLSSYGWIPTEVPLTNSPLNVCGETQVWFACMFQSDSSTQDEGAYVDNIVIQKDIPGGVTALAYYDPTNVLLQVISSSVVTSQVALSNLGTTNLVYSLDTHGTSWLTCVPTNGMLAPGGSVDILFIGDSTSLIPNAYTATLTCSRNDPNSPTDIPVTFIVPEPAGIILALVSVIWASAKRKQT